jgi:SNARE associated Golgi protein
LQGGGPAAAAVTALATLGVAATWWFQSHAMGGEHSISVDAAVTWMQGLLSHPQESLQSVVDSVHDMGPMGLVYFGLIYLVAEILAVPATPLTLSAGCLFGVTRGTAVVLVSATLAATFAFWIGKTVLRSWVEDRLLENPKFAKVDRAIGEQGFQLLLLVRLSPIFPFALSNYLEPVPSRSRRTSSEHCSDSHRGRSRTCTRVWWGRP